MRSRSARPRGRATVVGLGAAAVGVLAVAAAILVVLTTAPSTKPSPAPSRTPSPTPSTRSAGLVDLGTLGGARSEAVAVDGPIVVGWSDLAGASPRRHAFSYDLRAPAAGMTDLGTLGGADSVAVGVSGPVVVGWSTTASGRRHAFVYDVRAGRRRMVDLGTLGGSNSVAVAVAGATVVGWSQLGRGNARHAFAVGVGAAPTRMRDLGPGQATDISGALVSVANGDSGYLFDLAKRRSIDLTPIGDVEAGAVPTAVDGHVAVGWAWRGKPRYRYAFAYDVRHPEGSTDTAVLPGATSSAVTVRDGLLLGWSRTAGVTRVEALDLTDTRARLVDLGVGTPGSTDGFDVVAVTGDGRPFAVPVGVPGRPPRTMLARGLRPLAMSDGVVAGAGALTGGAEHALAWVLAEGMRLSSRFGTASIAWGQSTSLSARLTREGLPVAHASVTVYRRPYGATAWVAVTSLTTDDAGRVRTTVAARQNTDYVVRAGAQAAGVGTQSPVRTLQVRPQLSAVLSATVVAPGQAVTLAGRVWPAHPVALQAFTTSGWATASYCPPSATGSFRCWIRQVAADSYYYRVQTVAGRGYAAASTGLRTLQVRSVVPITASLSRLPNIVIVLTDDQRVESMPMMPNVESLLVAAGRQFTQAMVPTPLCCPSRATLLTGLYAHDTGTYSNGGSDGANIGGWRAFHRLGNENRTVAVALQRRGYRTALIGKYLNYYGSDAPLGYVPPGWDQFLAVRANHGAYYNYTLSDGERFGSKPSDYSTDVYAERALQFIRGTPAGRPLFLLFTPFAPHAPYTAAPRDIGTWAGRLPPYRAPSVFDDMVGKPAWEQGRAPTPLRTIDEVQQHQQDSLVAVDDAVARIISLLRDTGRLRNTLVIFSSDNGLMWGDHRMVGKDAPYAPAVRVPFVMRWDGHIAPGSTDPRLALNVDVAATIAAATGVPMRTDGLNLLGAQRRSGFVLEAAPGYGFRPAYCGYQTATWTFVQWASGERELYNVLADPYQVHNLAYTAGDRITLAALDEKARQACRPTPPGFTWPYRVHFGG